MNNPVPIDAGMSSKGSPQMGKSCRRAQGVVTDEDSGPGGLYCGSHRPKIRTGVSRTLLFVPTRSKDVAVVKYREGMLPLVLAGFRVDYDVLPIKKEAANTHRQSKKCRKTPKTQLPDSLAASKSSP